MDRGDEISDAHDVRDGRHEVDDDENYDWDYDGDYDEGCCGNCDVGYGVDRDEDCDGSYDANEGDELTKL
jgi:hypothetical protein